MHDQIFSTPLDKTARFSFDEQVVSVFPDMIRRSVPGYGQILAMISLLAQKQSQRQQSVSKKPIHIVDLGCSLGAVGLGICGRLPADAFSMTAVDLSEPMVTKATHMFANEYPQHDITVVQADITAFDLPPCDMVVLNFTLQFLPLDARDALIKRIYQALNPDGIIVLSEKFTAEDTQENDWLIDNHEAFKMANGYSEMEVSQKRASLEDVLIRETLAKHHERLAQAGFTQSHTWFQYLNFASMVAVK